jgi:hypothetical protein
MRSRSPSYHSPDDDHDHDDDHESRFSRREQRAYSDQRNIGQQSIEVVLSGAVDENAATRGGVGSGWAENKIFGRRL